MSAKKVSPRARALPPSRKREPTKYEGVFRRGSRYVIRYRDPKGRERQRSAATLKEARALRAELVSTVAKGGYREASRASLAQYAETWKESYAGRTNRRLRPETMDGYRRDIGRAVEFFGERLRLAEMTPAHVRSYATALASGELSGGRPLGPRTVRRYLSPLKLLLATAADDGLIPANPASGLRLGNVVAEPDDEDREQHVKALTPDELAALIAETPEGWQRTMVKLIAATGIRRSEALGMRWRNVDAKALSIKVLERARDGRTDRPKSSASRRQVPISPSMARELAELRLTSARSADADFVFGAPDGGPRHPSNVHRWFRDARDTAGLDSPVGFHSLRHTAASRWLLAGLTIAQVAKLLGHEDPGFTLRTYIHVMPSDLPDGARLAQAVGLD